VTLNSRLTCNWREQNGENAEKQIWSVAHDCELLLLAAVEFKVVAGELQALDKVTRRRGERIERPLTGSGRLQTNQRVQESQIEK
jgi:hypothetical protein